MNLLNYFRRLLNIKTDPKANRGDIPAELVSNIMPAVDHTAIEEYSCDQVYELLDQFTELVYRQEDADHLMPLVHHHLDMCGDCREEFEALLRILQSQNT
jgi:hypothetical protein